MLHRRHLIAALALVGLVGSVVAASRIATRATETGIVRARARQRAFLEARNARVYARDTNALQRGLNDCGVAVLREALRSLGFPDIARDSLERLAELTPYGTTLAALRRGVQRAGARTLDHETGVLGEHLTVAHFSLGHFVLVRSFESSKVRFFDPLVGEVEASTAVFNALWSGGAFRVLRDSGATSATDAQFRARRSRTQFSRRKP